MYGRHCHTELPPPIHILNLYYLHSPVQGVGRGHTFNFFSCATGTERVQRMNSAFFCSGLAVNNCDGLFKSAWSATWVQFTKSAKIYSDYRHVVCYQKKVGSVQFTVNNVCDSC